MQAGLLHIGNCQDYYFESPYTTHICGGETATLDDSPSAPQPLKVASGMDAGRLRAQYGQEIVMWGNVDKRALA